MDKDAFALQLLLVLRSCPCVMVSDMSLIIRNRLLLDSEDFQSTQEKESWEKKVRRVCAYLNKLHFIQYNGPQISLSSKGNEYVNLLYAPIAGIEKGDKEQ